MEIPWDKLLHLRVAAFIGGTELLSNDAMEIPVARSVGESTMQLLVAPGRQRQA